MNTNLAPGNKRRVFISALLLVVLYPTLTGSAFAAKGPYAVEVKKNVMVSMRDGIKLATDIYLPANKEGKVLDQRLPVILDRRPYNKNGAENSAMYFASHGYVFVAQDTRGRYASEGVWHMLTDDGRDGVDTAAWIGKQTWSNAKIGMIGTSYFGGTQHAMAMEKAPELKTVIPVDAMSNLGYASMRNGGAFELRFWNWIYSQVSKGSRQARNPDVAAILQEMNSNRRRYLQQLPLRKGTTPMRHAPEYEEWLVEGMKHGANDDFWKQNNIIDHPEKYKDIPVYLVSGWYDSWSSNNTANFMALSKTIKGPVYMIMGPWIHGQQASSAHGQVSFGKQAAIADPLGWRREWYDHWLKGIENSVGKAAPFQTPVRIFVMGTGDGSKTKNDKINHGGYWRNEQEWPLARTVSTKYYLQPAGQLSTKLPAVKESSTTYCFDPDNPVPTIGGNISSGNGILVQGGWNQRGNKSIWNFPDPIPLSARNDVIVFQTEPLEENLEVTGEISVTLWISSDAKDTDFTAKLIDVYPPSKDFPDGFDLNIGDGIIRTRFRDSLQKEKLMQPNEIYPVIIKLYPTSNVFKKGHRIRVDISSSNFPRFDINPNTGEPLNDNRRKQKANNTIYHNQQHPSHILLPVIPL